MTAKALVGGVGMIKFKKPGENEGYEVMSEKAIRLALEDAGIAIDDIQQAYASYCYGDSANGQSGFYRVKRTGIPIFNVNNNCASGSNALFLARQAVESGMADCVIAYGFEQMVPGALTSHWTDRYSPAIPVFESLVELNPDIPRDVPGAPAMFGCAGFEYCNEYGADPSIFAEVAVKTRKHAQQNPYALFTDDITVEDVMRSKTIVPPSLTRLMCCPPTCGAAAAIIVSESFARQRGISRTVRILGQGMASDGEAQLTSSRNIVGLDMTRRASKKAYEMAGLGPEDVQVVELHDCFTPNEVVTYGGLGLCGEGEATRFIADGDNTYGGKFVVNPSGGLMSKGHPIGATGLAQCTELVWHLRGDAEARQVEGARIALQHNIGIPGSCVVTLYEAA